VNQSGIVKATHPVIENGVIRLVANNDISISGQLETAVQGSDTTEIQVSAGGSVTIPQTLLPTEIPQ